MNSEIRKLIDSPNFLSKEEIPVLVQRYTEGDVDSGKALVEAFIPLLNSICCDFLNGYTMSISRDDLFQEAVIGFYKSLNSYNADKGNLSIYAMSYVKYQLMDYVLANRKMVKTITTKKFRKLYFNRNKYYNEKGEIDAAKMSEGEGIELPIVEEFKDRMKFNPLYVMMNEDGTVESPIDLLECSWNTIEQYEDHDQQEKVINTVKTALGKLRPRQRDIFERMYMNDEPETMSCIARDYGVSPQRIQQQEREAIVRLKETISL